MATANVPVVVDGDGLFALAWSSEGAAALLRARFLGSSSVGLLGMATGLRAEPDRVTELATALHTRAIPCLVAFGESDDAWPVPVQRDMAARLGAEMALMEQAAAQ